ncbi:hypothetical protein D039_0589A, partial [Vibrio parahaemolyticus EKP-028]
MIRSSFIC